MIACASALSMIPASASMAACAFEARMSFGAKPLSKPMDAFIASMISAGEAEKRPRHMLFAGLSVTAGGGPSGPVDVSRRKKAHERSPADGDAQALDGTIFMACR